MKKFLTIALITSLAFTSCTTIYKSASTQQITSSVTSAVTADLDVSEKKITYDYYHTNGGGLENAKNCAVSQALKQHGNADILVAPQFEISLRRGLFGTTIQKIVVSGYPAKYKNFKQIRLEDLQTNVEKEEVEGTKSVKISTPVSKPNAQKKSISQNDKEQQTPLYTKTEVETQYENSSAEVSEKKTSSTEVKSNGIPKTVSNTLEDTYKLGIEALLLGKTQESEKYFKEAADQGHREASYALGTYYFQKEEYKDGEKYLKKAAEAGDVDASYILGVYYLNKTAVYPNNLTYSSAAKKWLKKAVKGGHVEAKKDLDNYNLYQKMPTLKLNAVKKDYNRPSGIDATGKNPFR